MGVTTTTEQAGPTSASEEVGLEQSVFNATTGIAFGVGSKIAFGIIALATSLVMNNSSNNTRVMQVSHDQCMVAEANIQATAEVAKHNATVAVQVSHDQRKIAEAEIHSAAEVAKHNIIIAARERLLTKMVENGQYEGLSMPGNDQGSRRTKNGRKHPEIRGLRMPGLLESV
jgi:hypothetical protein